MDVMFDPNATVQVKVGQHVVGGESVLAIAAPLPAVTDRSTQVGVRA
jgi:hypothetical protein